MSENGNGKVNWPLGPLGSRVWKMSFHNGVPFSVRYVSGFFLASR